MLCSIEFYYKGLSLEIVDLCMEVCVSPGALQIVESFHRQMSAEIAIVTPAWFIK